MRTAKACELCTYAAAHKRPGSKAMTIKGFTADDSIVNTICCFPVRLACPMQLYMKAAMLTLLPGKQMLDAKRTKLSQRFQLLLLRIRCAQCNKKKGKPNIAAHCLCVLLVGNNQDRSKGSTRFCWVRSRVSCKYQVARNTRNGQGRYRNGDYRTTHSHNINRTRS